MHRKWTSSSEVACLILEAEKVSNHTVDAETRTQREQNCIVETMLSVVCIQNYPVFM
jgi:hypothetical protein